MLEVVRFRGVLISEHSHRMNKLLKSHQQKGQSMYSRRDRLMYGLGGLGALGGLEKMKGIGLILRNGSGG